VFIRGKIHQRSSAQISGDFDSRSCAAIFAARAPAFRCPKSQNARGLFSCNNSVGPMFQIRDHPRKSAVTGF
jgi:hypothetical protein